MVTINDESPQYIKFFYGRTSALIASAYISILKGVKLRKVNTTCICLGKKSKNVGLEPKDCCTKEYLLPRQEYKSTKNAKHYFSSNNRKAEKVAHTWQLNNSSSLTEE